VTILILLQILSSKRTRVSFIFISNSILSYKIWSTFHLRQVHTGMLRHTVRSGQYAIVETIPDATACITYSGVSYHPINSYMSYRFTNSTFDVNTSTNYTYYSITSSVILPIFSVCITCWWLLYYYVAPSLTSWSEQGIHRLFTFTLTYFIDILHINCLCWNQSDYAILKIDYLPITNNYLKLWKSIYGPDICMSPLRLSDVDHSLIIASVM
jgi:hypothetical protein